MKKLFCFLIICWLSSSIISAQENDRLFEKYRIGVGILSAQYVGTSIHTSGYKLELGLPIYSRLTANINYSSYASYHDFCDEIPVDVKERHIVTGLSYSFFEKGPWSFAALAALDIERTKYLELDHLPRGAKTAHSERITHNGEDHNSTEIFVEGLIGVEANLSLSKHFQLNAASRINTYGGFTNSLSLFYVFDLK